MQIRLYARLIRFDKPVGTWLLFLPGAWGIAFAAKSAPINLLTEIHFYLLFFLGAFLMRSAGCIYNDLIDRDIDIKVARTKTRPLASGEIQPKQAFVFGAVLCALAFLILLQFNLLTMVVGTASILLVAIYPFLKRITYWPQFFLGLTFNWGALVGYAAVGGGLSWTIGLLYLAGIFWTLYYDTIYALQDIEDDIKVGVKSSAIAMKNHIKPFLSIMAMFMIISLLSFAAITQTSFLFFVGMATLAAGLCYQIATLNILDAQNALQKFRQNQIFGWLVWVSLLADRL